MLSVALALGLGASYYALTDGRVFGALQVGPWLAWPDLGSPSPNPYSRAQIVRAGTFQLGLSEGIQFVASTDSEGEPLTRACSYRIEGTTPVSTFWTLVAVDDAGINIAAPHGPAVVRSQDLARGEGGAIVINLGTRLAARNWLELAGDGPFALRLTLYDTVVSSGFGGSLAMPGIAREACW